MRTSVDIVDIVDCFHEVGQKATVYGILCKTKVKYLSTKNRSLGGKSCSPRLVDSVDNYFFMRLSPIEYTFPAPIVINKSFFLQFFRR